MLFSSHRVATRQRGDVIDDEGANVVRPLYLRIAPTQAAVVSTPFPPSGGRPIKAVSRTCTEFVYRMTFTIIKYEGVLGAICLEAIGFLECHASGFVRILGAFLGYLPLHCLSTNTALHPPPP
jgi:hypothetical protein